MLSLFFPKFNFGIRVYNINKGNVLNDSSWIDNSTHNIFNFKECNIDIQGELNDLARLLRKKGHEEDAEELEDAVEALKEVENCENPDDVKRKGIFNRLKRMARDLGDPESKLGKKVAGMANISEIAGNLTGSVSALAQWLG